MCFGSRTVDDPTQQPIRITQSNEAHLSEEQPQVTTGRKGSYKNRPPFVDVTNKVFKTEPTLESNKPSTAEVPVAQLDPKKKKRGSSTNAMLGYGYGADFGASPGM